MTTATPGEHRHIPETKRRVRLVYHVPNTLYDAQDFSSEHVTSLILESFPTLVRVEEDLEYEIGNFIMEDGSELEIEAVLADPHFKSLEFLS